MTIFWGGPIDGEERTVLDIERGPILIVEPRELTREDFLDSSPIEPEPMATHMYHPELLKLHPATMRHRDQGDTVTIMVHSGYTARDIDQRITRESTPYVSLVADPLHYCICPTSWWERTDQHGPGCPSGYW